AADPAEAGVELRPLPRSGRGQFGAVLRGRFHLEGPDGVGTVAPGTDGAIERPGPVVKELLGVGPELVDPLHRRNGSRLVCSLSSRRGPPMAVDYQIVSAASHVVEPPYPLQLFT